MKTKSNKAKFGHRHASQPIAVDQLNLSVKIPNETASCSDDCHHQRRARKR